MKYPSKLPLPDADSPDYRHGYLRIPHRIWEAVYCKTPFTRRQLQLLSVILRQSWGWRSPEGGVCLWTRPLTKRQLAAATGLSTDHLARDLRDLIARGVLEERDRRYRFLPHPDQWITSTSGETNQRTHAPESTTEIAKTAVTTPGIKKRKKEKRNTHSANVQLSPTGETSAPPRPANVPPVGDKLSDILAAFVGPLTMDDKVQLKRWVARIGAAAVWQTLEPLLRQRNPSVRSHLEAYLLQEGASGRRSLNTPPAAKG